MPQSQLPLDMPKDQQSTVSNKAFETIASQHTGKEMLVVDQMFLKMAPCWTQPFLLLMQQQKTDITD